jgi:hypothetical protein
MWRIAGSIILLLLGGLFDMYWIYGTIAERSYWTRAQHLRAAVPGFIPIVAGVGLPVWK